MTAQPFNIADLFFDAAEKYPNRAAIYDGFAADGISYSELALQVRATADYFHDRGIRKGDRVLVFVPMSTDLYRIVLALFHMGATAVFLDEWVSRERLEVCCRVAQCKAWIGGWKVKVLALFTRELRKMPVRLGVVLPLSPPPKGETQASSLEGRAGTVETDTALITFTTGSTGTPKAAKRTHGFLSEQFKALIDKIQPQPEDIDMPVLPIVLLLNLGVGCSSVIAPYKASRPHMLKPERIVELMQLRNVNRLTASPFFVKTVAQYVAERQIVLPALRKAFTGGAPVFPNEAEIYVKAFPAAQVEIVYGSTESEPISAIAAQELAAVSVSGQGGLPVGQPYHGAQVKIIAITDEPILCRTHRDLEQLELQAGQIGEIIVSGKHVLREYLNNEEALLRNKIFIGDDCWHRTGDSGFLNANGELLLTGRCSSLIGHNGQLIAPFIVENEIQSLHEIEIGTVLKINEKLVCFIEMKKGVSISEEIRSKLMFQLSFIDEIKVLKRIPRDPRHHSRIEYGKLKKLL